MSIDTYLKAKSEGFSDEKIIELSNFTKKLKVLKDKNKSQTSFRNIDTCSENFSLLPRTCTHRGQKIKQIMLLKKKLR